MHAIGEFSASIAFFRPLSGNAFGRASSALSDYAASNGIPAPVNQQVVTVEFGVQGVVPTVNQPPSAGWQRFAPNGEADLTVSCDLQSIHYVSRNYTKWVEVRDQLADFFVQVGSAYLSEVPALSTIQIRYTNEFRSVTSEPRSADELFRESNVWLVPALSRFKDAWHSHMGAFEDISGNHRRLINVNVDCQRQKSPDRDLPSTYITNLIIVSENYDVPGEKPLVIPPQLFREVLLHNLDSAHAREKDILRELYSDPYLELMGANNG